MPIPQKTTILFDGDIERYKSELTSFSIELAELEKLDCSVEPLDFDLHTKIENLKKNLINLHQFQDLDVFKLLPEKEKQSLNEVLTDLNEKSQPFLKIIKKSLPRRKTLTLEENIKNIELLKELEQQHSTFDVDDENISISKIPPKYISQIGGINVISAKFKQHNVVSSEQNIEKIVKHLDTHIRGGNCKEVFNSLMQPENLEALDLTCSSLWKREKLYFTDETNVRRMDALALLLSTSNPCTAIAFLNDSLVIASNSVKTQQEQEQLLDEYKERLRLLKDCLNKLKEAEPSEVKSCCNIQSYRLALPGKHNKDSADLFRDFLSKLYKEKFIINGYNILDILSGDDLAQVNIVITLFTEDLNLHAEQIIFARAKTIGIPTKDLIIGINKLCCQTCIRILLAKEEEAPLVRGSHMFSYHKTAGLSEDGEDLKYEEVMRLLCVNEGPYNPNFMTASCVVSRTTSNGSNRDFPEDWESEKIKTQSSLSFFSMTTSADHLAQQKERETESCSSHISAK